MLATNSFPNSPFKAKTLPACGVPISQQENTMEAIVETPNPAAEPEETNDYSATMQLALSRLRSSIGSIEQVIELHERHPKHATHLLADAYLLYSILDDWCGNEGINNEDGESPLIACIKLNIDN